jgi:hypothetical protein
MDRPECVFNLLEDHEFIDRTLQIPQEILEMSETRMVQEIPGGVSRVDRRARLAFWDEYEAAAKDLRTMDLDAVLVPTGAGKWANYSKQLLTNVHLHAWFMNPPAAYLVQMREAQDLGLSRLMEILELPMLTKSGQVNTKVGELVLKAYMLVDQRLNGGIVQKMVQVGTQHHMHQAVGSGATVSANNDQLLEKLKELEEKLKGMGALPEGVSGG